MEMIVGGLPPVLPPDPGVSDRTEHGVLLPGGAQIEGRFGTRLLAAVHARRRRPGTDDFILVHTTPRGWRTRDGKSVQQAAHERWGARRHLQAS